MSRLDHRVIVGLLIFYIVADSHSFRTKEGICKRCSCEKLNVGPNQTLKVDCSRLPSNDVEDLLGYGNGEYGGAWSIPYGASQGYSVIKIILDANVIHHLRPLPALTEELKDVSGENETGSTVAATSEHGVNEVDATVAVIPTTSPAETASPSIPKPPPLIEVSFRRSHLRSIDAGTFAALSKTIWSIDLADNDLTYDALPASVFRGEFSNQRYEALESLTKLDLARNMLHSLDGKIFEHISDTLEDLNLQGNALGNSLDTVTEHALSTLTKLKTLNLADVGISSFPEGLAHALISLENLRLDGNKLTVVPASLSEASSSLLYLSLNRNPITKINGSSFVAAANRSAWSKLETLDITAMTELCYINAGSFENLIELRNLRCAYNKKLIHFDEGAFRRISDHLIEWERWNGFKLKKAAPLGSDAFAAASLRYRRCVDYLSSGSYPSIYLAWVALPGAISIAPASTALVVIGTHKPFHHDKLELQGNGLQWLAPSVAPWSELDSADLQGNPWFCECALKPLANSIRVFIRTKAPNMSTGLLCFLPDSLRGINFLTTYSDDYDSIPDKASDDEVWTRNPGAHPKRLWVDCDKPRMVMTSRSALASALSAVAITVLVSLLIMSVLVYVVKKSIHVESLNLPGQVRYVKAPHSKDEDDEQVIMDMRWGAALKDTLPARTAVVLDSKALGTEYKWPRS